MASEALHGVVAVVDREPWWGAVSWRKPVAFGVPFACSPTPPDCTASNSSRCSRS
jgi:hypothetical protein